MDKWISVNEKLPEKRRHYLCITKLGSYGIWYWDIQRWTDGDGLMRDPSHWMLLPAPPDA